MPGDNTSIHVELIQPIAMEEGLRFAIVRVAGPSAPAGSSRSTSRQPGDPVASTDKRPHVILACTECKRRNYITTKTARSSRGGWN